MVQQLNARTPSRRMSREFARLSRVVHRYVDRVLMTTGCRRALSRLTSILRSFSCPLFSRKAFDGNSTNSATTAPGGGAGSWPQARWDGAVGLVAASDPVGPGVEARPAVLEVRTKDDLPTPALLVDLDRFQTNIEKMAGIAGPVAVPFGHMPRRTSVRKSPGARWLPVREESPWQRSPKRRRWLRPESAACC